MGISEFVNQTLRRPAYVLPVAFVVLLLDFVALMVTGPTRVRTGNDRAGTVQPGVEATPVESLPPEEAAAAAARAASARRSSSRAGTTVGKDVAISDTEIAVGMLYVTNPGSTNSAFGFTGAAGQVDQKRAWETMVKEVNRNAPFGRRVVPVYYFVSEQDAIAKGDGLWEEACAKWTRDNKVFMAWIAGPETLRACLTKNRVASIGGGTGFSYAKTFKDHPWYVETNSAALDRMAQFEVDQLFARGYFSQCRTDSKATLACEDGKPRIALIRYDQPSFKAAATTMKAALASHGLSLCDGCEFEMTFGATADVQAQLDDATETNNAVVSCKGVHTAPGAPPGPCTHMLFLGSNSGCRQQFFYTKAAEDQNYRARLGLNSLDCGGDWDGYNRPDIADNQYKEAVMVSHIPGESEQRGAPAFQDCKKLFTDGGETFGGQDDPNNNKEGQIDGYCDTAWYHIAVFNKVGKTVNLDTFLNGVANTGAVKSAGAFLMRTTATRHDGAGAIRIKQWDPGECRCFKPLTGDIPV